MKIYYNQKIFSLVNPNMAKLTSYIKQNFKQEDKFNPVTLSLELDSVYGADDQNAIRKIVVLRSNKYEDDILDLRLLYFIGKTIIGDILAVNKSTGEVYMMYQTDPDSYYSQVSPNLRDYAISNLDGVKGVPPAKIKDAMEFAKHLTGNI